MELDYASHGELVMISICSLLASAAFGVLAVTLIEIFATL